MFCLTNAVGGEGTIDTSFVAGDERSVALGGCSIAVHARVKFEAESDCSKQLVVLAHAVRRGKDRNVLCNFLSVEVDDSLVVGHDFARNRRVFE